MVTRVEFEHIFVAPVFPAAPKRQGKPFSQHSEDFQSELLSKWIELNVGQWVSAKDSDSHWVKQKSRFAPGRITKIEDALFEVEMLGRTSGKRQKVWTFRHEIKPIYFGFSLVYTSSGRQVWPEPEKVPEPRVTEAARPNSWSNQKKPVEGPSFTVATVHSTGKSFRVVSSWTNVFDLMMFDKATGGDQVVQAKFMGGDNTGTLDASSDKNLLIWKPNDYKLSEDIEIPISNFCECTVSLLIPFRSC